MTKTLTEQWRDGTLDGGIYYLLLRDGTTTTDKTVYIVGEKQLRWHYSSFDFVKEVLAPVPSYEKVKDMSQKIERLEFDNEALEMAHNEGKEINAELEQYNKDLLQDHTRLVMECDGLLAEKKQLEKKLEIATKELKELETKSDKFDNSWSMQEQLDFIKAKCQETLYQLK